MCHKMFCIYSFNTLFWWETYLQFATLYKNTNIIRPTGSTMHVDNLLNSVPVQTTRIPCSRGLQLIEYYILRIVNSSIRDKSSVS